MTDTTLSRTTRKATPEGSALPLLVRTLAIALKRQVACFEERTLRAAASPMRRQGPLAAGSSLALHQFHICTATPSLVPVVITTAVSI